MRKNFGSKPWFYPLPVLIIGTYIYYFKYNGISDWEVWKNEAAVFEGEPRRHLFVYAFVRNLMEASFGN